MHHEPETQTALMGIALKMSALELAEARKRAKAFSDAVGNAERNPLLAEDIPALVEIQTVGVADLAKNNATAGQDGASWTGEVYKVHVLKEVNPNQYQIEVAPGEHHVVAIFNLPRNVWTFVEHINSLRQEVASGPVNQTANTQYEAAAIMTMNRNRAAAQAELAAMEPLEPATTTVLAAPTRRQWLGLPVWTYVGKPSPASSLQNGAAPTMRVSRAVSATASGVPIDVYNSIAASAEKQWPGDYEMQEYTIKKQVEAYKALHP